MSERLASVSLPQDNGSLPKYDLRSVYESTDRYMEGCNQDHRNPNEIESKSPSQSTRCQVNEEVERNDSSIAVRVESANNKSVIPNLFLTKCKI
jgi:hypothetical protein